jgi:hypothetical protein
LCDAGPILSEHETFGTWDPASQASDMATSGDAGNIAVVHATYRDGRDRDGRSLDGVDAHLPAELGVSRNGAAYLQAGLLVDLGGR